MNRTRNSAACWACLLALLLLPALASLAPAAETCVAAAVTPAPVVLGSLRSILGDQGAMIQVACVVGAIAIFWLSRSIK